jgi:hypothetical protein
MTAFSCGSPVSFFGDHFQLPPICEMNTKEIKEEHPEARLIIVSLDARPRLFNGVEVWPAQRFLQQLWAGKIAK